MTTETWCDCASCGMDFHLKAMYRHQDMWYCEKCFKQIYDELKPAVGISMRGIFEKIRAENEVKEAVGMRVFETGATRDVEEGKIDYEGFLSPYALRCYGEYLHKHRVQADGNLRDSDNWQKGIPKNVYMKSAWRHFFSWWEAHREGRQDHEAICGLLFNAMGYLHEELKK